MDFDAATVLLQWATGGLAFCWVTTRHQLLGVGYGWLLRGVLRHHRRWAASWWACARDTAPVREAAGGWRCAGHPVRPAPSRSGLKDEGPKGPAEAGSTSSPRSSASSAWSRRASTPAGPTLLAVARFVVGAAFLGAITDAMLLGHWYLVQPGLARDPLWSCVALDHVLWFPEVWSCCWPVGMVSVLNGTIDDGYGGLLGWFWVTCAVTTIGLLVVTRLALRENASTRRSWRPPACSTWRSSPRSAPTSWVAPSSPPEPGPVASGALVPAPPVATGDPHQRRARSGPPRVPPPGRPRVRARRLPGVRRSRGRQAAAEDVPGRRTALRRLCDVLDPLRRSADDRRVPAHPL